MKNLIKSITVAILTVFSVVAFAQITPNNQRYLAISEVYPIENVQATISRMRTSKNLGCNAFNFTIDYRLVNGFAQVPDVWGKYKLLMDEAVALNFKIGIRVAMDNATLQSTVGGATDNNAQICCGTVASERMLGKLLNGLPVPEKVYQAFIGGSPTNPGEFESRFMTSLEAQSTKNRITSFALEVINRYKNDYANNLLWINATFTAEQESGYPFQTSKGNETSDALFDYSAPMVNNYRTWLQAKYVTIAALNLKWSKNYTGWSDSSIYPKIPTNTFQSAFTNDDGRDWFEFRTKVLKDANELFATAIHSQMPNLRVISDYGSVFDNMSIRRGTFNFSEINKNIDGIKINDAPDYDHRFAMDLIRSNMPGKFVSNEVEWSSNQENNILPQFVECFNHGANWVNIFQFQNMIDAGKGNILTTVANQFINSNNTVPVINPSQTATFNLSSYFSSAGCTFTGNAGNYTENNGCSAYAAWRAKYNLSNSPVNLIMNDDITSNLTVVVPNNSGCNVAAPTGVSANPFSVVLGSGSTLSGTCPPGTTIVYGTPNGTASVSPTTVTTYSVTCRENVSSSLNSNTVTITTSGPPISTSEKVLILGNSMVSYSPDITGLGWAGNWGMAASSANSDFVSKLRNHYLGLNSSNVVYGYNMVTFEFDFANMIFANNSYFTSIRDNQNWTTIILRLGENVQSGYNSNIFKQKCLEFINFMKNGRSGVKVIITNCFWTDTTKDADFQSLATTNNFSFANLTGLYTFNGINTAAVGYPNAAVLSNANPAVLNHPNDAGMLAIANRIIAVIN